jgi:uncharacterized membrane protein
MGALSGAAWVVCLVRWSVCYCSIRSSDWRQAWPSAPARARCRALSDYGIDDDFMRSTGQNIEAGSSALFILVRRVNFDKVQAGTETFRWKGIEDVSHERSGGTSEEGTGGLKHQRRGYLNTVLRRMV